MQVIHRKSTIIGIKVLRWITAVVFWLSLCVPLVHECFVTPPPARAGLTFSTGTIARNRNPHERVYPFSVIPSNSKTEIHLLNAPSVSKLPSGSLVSVGWYSASRELKLGVVVENGDETVLAYWPAFDIFYHQRFAALLCTLFWAIAFGVLTLGMTKYPVCILFGVPLVILAARVLPYFDHNFTTFWCVVFLLLQAFHGPAIRAQAFRDGNVDFVSIWPE